MTILNTRGLRLHKTCESCPEQYDVYNNDRLVGYMRLRWGYFCVYCPDVGGEEVYHVRVGGDMQGSFTSQEERIAHLNDACLAILRFFYLLETRKA